MAGHDRYNFDAFESACKWLEAAGYDVLSPHRMDLKAGFDPDQSLDINRFSMVEAIKRDVEAICVADSIYMLKGWECSPGATAEWAIARALEKPMYYQSNP